MGGVKKRVLQKRKQLVEAREIQKRKREEEKQSDTQPDSTSSSTTSGTPPTSVSTSAAKRRKLEVCSPYPSTREAVDDENIILKKSHIQHMFCRVACRKCYAENLKVRYVNKLLDFNIELECEVCGEVESCGDDSTVQETPITKTMVYSSMEVGLGQSNFNKLLGNMNMKPLQRCYPKVQREVMDVVQTKVESVLEKTVEAVKRHYVPEEDGIYNVSVMYDGSWQKRGHTY